MIGPFLAMAFAPVAAQLPLSSAEAEVRSSWMALAPHIDSAYRLDRSNGSANLLDRHWAKIRRWTESWLDRNGVHPRRLARVAAGIDKDLELAALPVAPGVLAVSVQEEEIGTIFIVRRTPSGYRTVWTISAPGRAALAAFPTLAGWSATKASQDCRTDDPSCGPLYGRLRRLPAQRDGQKRFYLDASYAGQGSLIGAQISIWRWNGRSAVPLFAGTYGYTIVQPYQTRFDGKILHVAVRGEFKSFFACSGCNGRQMDWRIAVGPKSVRDMGRLDRYPELVFADDLLDRLIHHRQPPPGAATADLRVLRRQLSDAGDGVDFGMLAGWTLRRRGHLEELCLSPEPETDTFAFDTRGASLRLVSVREGPLHGCGDRVND